MRDFVPSVPRARASASIRLPSGRRLLIWHVIPDVDLFSFIVSNITSSGDGTEDLPLFSIFAQTRSLLQREKAKKAFRFAFPWIWELMNPTLALAQREARRLALSNQSLCKTTTVFQRGLTPIIENFKICKI
jgi:hypothetical protein